MAIYFTFALAGFRKGKEIKWLNGNRYSILGIGHHLTLWINADFAKQLKQTKAVLT